MVMVQQPLGLTLRPEFSLERFLGRQNSALLNSLKEFLQGHLTVPVFYLWGGGDSGRTHLLQAACREWKGDGAIYLPMAEPLLQSPAVLTDLEACGLVCLDDIQFLQGRGDLEESLFAAFNRFQETSTRLLVASDAAPTQGVWHLADLCSRLASGLVWELGRLDEDELVELMIARALDLGLELGSDIASYLVNRLPRHPSALLGALSRLDEAAMVAKQRITLPFARKILELA